MNFPNQPSSSPRNPEKEIDFLNEFRQRIGNLLGNGIPLDQIRWEINNTVTGLERQAAGTRKPQQPRLTPEQIQQQQKIEQGYNALKDYYFTAKEICPEIVPMTTRNIIKAAQKAFPGKDYTREGENPHQDLFLSKGVRTTQYTFDQIKQFAKQGFWSFKESNLKVAQDGFEPGYIITSDNVLINARVDHNNKKISLEYQG